MSDQFKIFLVVLAGIALSLSACGDDVGTRTPSTPTAANNSPSPTPTASAGTLDSPADNSPSPTPTASAGTPDSPAHPQVSPSPAGNINGLAAQAQRSNYKLVPLDKISSSHSLEGTDPKAIALAAFSDTEAERGTQAVAVDYPQSDKAIVNITQVGVGDDSVGSIRYRVEFMPKSSDKASKQWEIVWAGAQFKCRTGRGHQDWSAQNCH